MKWYLWVLVAVLIGLISWANLAQGDYKGQKTDYAPQVAESLNLPPKQAKNQAILAQIDRLAECESGNNINALNPDDGGTPSYGLYQWKEDSFWRYNLIYRVAPDLERQEIMNIIYDREVQTKLTKLVLSEPNGYKNWLNCYKQITNS